jgi:hypothetical protein
VQKQKIIIYHSLSILSFLIDETSDHIANQERRQKANHEELLEDLETIRQSANSLWEKIGKFCML